MGKLSVQKGSAERSERFFSGLPLMYGNKHIELEGIEVLGGNLENVLNILVIF